MKIKGFFLAFDLKKKTKDKLNAIKIVILLF